MTGPSVMKELSAEVKLWKRAKLLSNINNDVLGSDKFFWTKVCPIRYFQMYLVDSQSESPV